MRFTIVLFVFTVFISNLGYGFYYRTCIWELIEKSDAIVTGEIVGINSHFFKISVKDNLKGLRKNTSLIITKFQDWSCSSRYSDYKLGQKAFYFLEYRNGNYEVLGAANEGEFIIEQDSVSLFESNNHLSVSKFSYEIVLNGILWYFNNQRQIDIEFKVRYDPKRIIDNGYSIKPTKNEFVNYVLNERLGCVINLR